MHNMKKTYQRPTMEIMDMDMQQILAASTASGLHTNGNGSIESENEFGSRHKDSMWDTELWSE